MRQQWRVRDFIKPLARGPYALISDEGYLRKRRSSFALAEVVDGPPTSDRTRSLAPRRIGMSVHMRYHWLRRRIASLRRFSRRLKTMFDAWCTGFCRSYAVY